MRLVFTIETGDAERTEPVTRTLLGRLAERQGRLEGVRGDDDVPSSPTVAEAPPVAPGRLDAAWEKLVDAQRRLTEELGKDPAKDRERVMWVGGAMAIYAACSGETEREVGRRLGEAVPTETWNGIPVRPAHETERPAPPPGAQRAVSEDDPPLEPDPGLAQFVTPPPPDTTVDG